MKRTLTYFLMLTIMVGCQRDDGIIDYIVTEPSVLIEKEQTLQKETLLCDPWSIDEVIFGYDDFWMSAVAFFKIKDGQLFKNEEGRFDQETWDDFSMITEAESEEDYQLAKSFIQFIPENLLNDHRSSFGCPDCTDQGTIYLKIIRNGETFGPWKIDPIGDINCFNEFLFPKYLIPFRDKIRDIVYQLVY